MFALSLTSLILLLTIANSRLVLMLILLTVIITSALGINALLISLVPLSFGRYGYAATMTGILNSTAAVSCGISTYIAGLLAKTNGWDFVFLIFAILSALGLIISLAISARWMRFKRK